MFHCRSQLRVDPFEGSQSSEDSRDNPFSVQSIFWSPSLIDFWPHPFSTLYDTGTEKCNLITKRAVQELGYKLKPLSTEYNLESVDELTTQASHFITPSWRVHPNPTIFKTENFLVVDKIQEGEEGGVDVLLCQKFLRKQKKAGRFIFVLKISKKSKGKQRSFIMSTRSGSLTIMQIKKKKRPRHMCVSFMTAKQLEWNGMLHSGHKEERMGQLQRGLEPKSQKTKIVKCIRQVINRPMSELKENGFRLRMNMHRTLMYFGNAMY